MADPAKNLDAIANSIESSKGFLGGISDILNQSLNSLKSIKSRFSSEKIIDAIKSTSEKTNIVGPLDKFWENAPDSFGSARKQELNDQFEINKLFGGIEKSNPVDQKADDNFFNSLEGIINKHRETGIAGPIDYSELSAPTKSFKANIPESFPAVESLVTSFDGSVSDLISSTNAATSAIERVGSVFLGAENELASSLKSLDDSIEIDFWKGTSKSIEGLGSAISSLGDSVQSFTSEISNSSSSIISWDSGLNDSSNQMEDYISSVVDSVSKMQALEIPPDFGVIEESANNASSSLLELSSSIANQASNYADIQKNASGSFSSFTSSTEDFAKRISDSIPSSSWFGGGLGGGGGNGGDGGGGDQPSGPMKDGPAGSMFQYIDEADNGLMVLSGKSLIAAQAFSTIGMAAYAAGKAFIGFSKMMAEIPSTFVEIVNMIGGFVKALDPAIMQQLSLAFSDLYATVGVALRPLISVAIAIVRAWADNLLPIVQKLEPIMNLLGEKILSLAGTYIGMSINIFEQFIPVIESLIPILDDLNEIFILLVPVMVWGFDALGRVLNFIIGIFHSFMVGIKMITIAILEAAAWVTSWFSKKKSESIKGMSSAVQESMNRSLKAQSDAFGRAFGPSARATQGEQGGAAGLAAKNATYAGIADLGKGMMQAAFGTGTKGPQERTANGVEKIAEGIGDIVKWVGGMAKENKKMAGVRR